MKNGCMSFNEILDEQSHDVTDKDSKVELSQSSSHALTILIKHDLVKAIFSDKHWNY